MPNLPDPPADWPDIPIIATTDRVLGGENGPANAQARALMARMNFVKEGLETAQAALGAAQSRVATAEAMALEASQDVQAAALDAHNAGLLAAAAQSAAGTAQSTASAAATAAGTAQTTAAAAQTAAAAADTKATAADTKATAAQTAATNAQTAAGTADTNATQAKSIAQAKATRIDLGSVTIVYTAAIILGAGARSIEATCTGAQVGDAIFVAPTGAVPDGYAVGAAQCLVADKIRVSIVHPALALGANFSIPLRVFALR